MDFATSLAMAWIALHVSGLAVSWLVRVQAGRRSQDLAQLAFLTCLAAVALITVIGYLNCWAVWIVSATTLVVMVVTSIADLSENEQVTADIAL